MAEFDITILEPATAHLSDNQLGALVRWLILAAKNDWERPADLPENLALSFDFVAEFTRRKEKSKAKLSEKRSAARREKKAQEADFKEISGDKAEIPEKTEISQRKKKSNQKKKESTLDNSNCIYSTVYIEKIEEKISNPNFCNEKSEKKLQPPENQLEIFQACEILPKTSPKTGISQAEMIALVVSYLNEKTGKAFRPNTKATATAIMARINDGYSFDDFKRVIDLKSEKWGNDPKMVDYLRPITLFSPTNFENYLNEKPTSAITQPKNAKNGRHDTTGAIAYAEANRSKYLGDD